jgi:hypothetical protein
MERCRASNSARSKTLPANLLRVGGGPHEVCCFGQAHVGEAGHHRAGVEQMVAQCANWREKSWSIRSNTPGDYPWRLATCRIEYEPMQMTLSCVTVTFGISSPTKGTTL